jgi:hypothetical protein
MSFMFPEQSIERLEKIKSQTELTSYTDIVRQSLRLYEWMLNQTAAGNDFIIKDGDGNETKVDIFVSG